MLLLAGPRLDGARLDGIEFEAMQMLARGAAATFEAGLLRERAEDEARFRQGLTDLARDLAAAGDRQRCAALPHDPRRAPARGQSASLWRRGPDGAVAVLDDDSADARSPTVASARSCSTHASGAADQRDWTE